MRRTCLAVAAAWAAVVIGVAGQAAPGERFATWSVPSSFPLPRVPADNPLTPAKVAGRARLRAVARHPRVVEQMAPQLHEPHPSCAVCVLRVYAVRSLSSYT